jgi:hypothetical protein
MRRSNSPTKMFNDMEDAIAWLHEQKKNEGM